MLLSIRYFMNNSEEPHSPCIKRTISLRLIFNVVQSVTAVAEDRRSPAVAVVPQIAIGTDLAYSKPTRSAEPCRGQCQRHHLHPNARSRSILHHRLRRAPEQLPTR